MAVEKALKSPTPEEVSDNFFDVEVDVGDDEEDFDEAVVVEITITDHASNIAETMDETELAKIASELVSDFNMDRRSREEWAKAYVTGMDLLGMKIEDRDQPFEGASGVFHPVLTETIIRFQAQAIEELFPAAGPARTKVVGKKTEEKMSQAQRVEDELNYQLTEEMVEYRDEMEQLLFHLPMAGSAFKKVWFDPVEGRAKACFVPAEDVVVNYGATDLYGAERVTHVMRKNPDEVEALQEAGFYLDVDLPEPTSEFTDVQEKYDEIAGERPTLIEDGRHTILEVQTNLRFEDDGELARPYVVTIDKSSSTVLAIRRNWDEADERKRKLTHLIHYKYLPGLGFYGTGLIHLLGGLTKTATSLLRQLIDAGTFSNLPAGLKARGLRIKGDNTPFRPGEIRDVDVPGARIADSISFLPFKEPSTVLYQLLDMVIGEARRIGSTSDSDISKINGEMPVGTTFALLEREMKVMSAVQRRLHAALKKELRLISKMIGEFMGPEYAYDDEQEFDRRKDFSSKVDVIPVSDPNASTAAQRVVSYQAALQLSAQAPQFYNQAKLHRQMLEVLGIDNASEIVALPEDVTAKDPVTENMAILNQEAVQAFEYQDHAAHIQVHMAAAQDPKIQEIVGQSPFAGAIQSAFAAHLTEHLAFQYRKEIQKRLGVSLPPSEELLPEEVEVEVSRLAAEAAGKLLQDNRAETAAQQAKELEQNPLTQIQRKELEIKEKDVEYRHQAEMKRIEIDAFKKGADITQAQERLESEERRAGAQIGARLATETKREDNRQIKEGADIALRVAENLTKEDQKETAMKAARNGAQNGGENG
jgi:hypothetical protein